MTNTANYDVPAAFKYVCNQMVQ